ncbi:MAG: hypothetical protein ABEK01_00715 [Candidatus Nanohaloarchaea archaeon]
MINQKVGDLQLTLQALLTVLEENDVIEEEEINERAQEIVEEMQEQQQEMESGDLQDELEEE